MTSPLSEATGFIFRDARSDDKEQVLEFTAHTWEFGDYIQYVYDEWLDDKSGLFLVAEEEESGKLAAIDKLTVLSPTEAWFEGLRVNPDFRGRGLAGSLQRFMIAEARRLGAKRVRLLTLVSNSVVHHNAYRDGFARLFTARFWKWQPTDQEGAPASDYDLSAVAVRQATREEAPLLYEWWQKSSAFATGGLLHRSWSFSETSAEEWVGKAGAGELYIPEEVDTGRLVLPPPMAMILPEREEGGRVVWRINLLAAPNGEWAGIARGLIECAEKEGIVQIEGLLPDSVGALRGLKHAGFVHDEDDEGLCLFELRL